MDKEKLKRLHGLHVTVKTDSTFIKGKLTHVDEDSVILTDAECIQKPHIFESYSDSIVKTSWLVLNPFKIWDAWPTYEQVSNNYTISSKGLV